MDDTNLFTAIDYAEQAIISNNVNFIDIGVKVLDRNLANYEISEIVSDLSLLRHSLILLNIDADNYLVNISNSVSKELRDEILDFCARDIEDKTIEAMGYSVVNNPVFHYQFL